MTFFCTYCSAGKDRSEGELPAIQRYQSPRLKSVYTAAKSLGLGFLILSGEYGILEPDDPIPYYVHLLQSVEVPEHSKLVANQLDALGVKDLIFFTMPDSVDENVKPYCECIKLASQKAGIELKYVTCRLMMHNNSLKQGFRKNPERLKNSYLAYARKRSKTKFCTAA